MAFKADTLPVNAIGGAGGVVIGYYSKMGVIRYNKIVATIVSIHDCLGGNIIQYGAGAGGMAVSYVSGVEPKIFDPEHGSCYGNCDNLHEFQSVTNWSQ